MSRLFKRWWLLAAAMMTALAVVLASAVPALAAEPGESASWNAENVDNGGTLQSSDTYSEARGGNTGTLVQIWRGLDNRVWLAANNGPVFAADSNNNTTTTYVAPRVVYSNGWFYAFQTGTDNHIYWSRVADGRTGAGTPYATISNFWSQWTAISGSPATTQSVSVASAPGSGLLMTWIGVGETTMYSAWLNNGTDVFANPRIITNANGNSAPVVAFNPVYNDFVVVFRGLDNQVYIMYQALGQTGWSNTQVLAGITTNTSPTVAAAPNGDQLVSAIQNNNIWFQAMDVNGVTRGWRMESAQQATYAPLWISVVGNIFFAVATLTSYHFAVYWKQAWDSSKGI
jgi:hypothetical protein